MKMKASKKSTAIIAFVLGMLLLMSTALADTFIGSGYTSFKDAVKTTAGVITSGEMDSFEQSINIAINVDGVTYIENTEKMKYDFIGNKRENISTQYNFGESSEYYSYTDSTKSISKSSRDDKYYVVEYKGGYTLKASDRLGQNPFEEDRAADAEKIIDAFVGNLAELVQVEEYDGKKMFIGSLSEAQIPALANALASYVLKYEVARSYNYNDYKAAEKTIQMPLPESNVFIQSASGKAVQNELGAFESLLAEASASADDKNGVTHQYTLEISYQMTGVGSTVVTEPDLAGSEVEYSEQYLTKDGYNSLTDKVVGVYNADIIVESAGKLVKTGENWFEVISVSEDSITGRFYELDSEGNEVYSQDISAIVGEDDYRWNFIFDYTDANGEAKQGIVNRTDGKELYVNFGVTMYENGGYSSEEWVSYRRFFE